MKYGIIEQNVITQTLQSNYIPEEPYVEIPDEADVRDFWDGETLTKAEPLPPAVRTHFSRMEFRSRFTSAEKVALYTAAETDVMIKVFLDDLSSAEYVDVTDEDTVTGIEYIEQIGIISGERKSDILATAVMDANL